MAGFRLVELEARQLATFHALHGKQAFIPMLGIAVATLQEEHADGYNAIWTHPNAPNVFPRSDGAQSGPLELSDTGAGFCEVKVRLNLDVCELIHFSTPLLQHILQLPRRLHDHYSMGNLLPQPSAASLQIIDSTSCYLRHLEIMDSTCTGGDGMTKYTKSGVQKRGKHTCCW